MIEKIQRIKAEIEALKVSKSEDLENTFSDLQHILITFSDECKIFIIFRR